jgi:YVTN family beta-propeller protein
MLGSQTPSKAMREAWPISSCPSSCPVWTRPVRVVMTFVALVLVLAATLVFPSPARADGGAPNPAYIAGGGSSGNQLVVIDIGQRRVASKIAIGGRPAGVVLSTDGRYAYVTESADNALAIVDANARQVVARVSLATAPTALALDLADTPNLLFISDSGSGMVSVVDPSTRRVRATIPVGMHPAGLAVALPGTGISATGPHDAEVYVANTLSNTVSVISTRLLRVIATIPAWDSLCQHGGRYCARPRPGHSPGRWSHFAYQIRPARSHGLRRRDRAGLCS